MSNPLASRIGGIPSADIAVPDHEHEVRFYSRVLGTGAAPLWREDLMNNQGAPIIGLGPRSPDYANLPLQWMPHIQVADVAASVEKGLALGGTELIHGKDDKGNSLWAVLQDPGGATFGMIPVVAPGDVPVAEAGGPPVGCIAWVDLTVPEASATRDFYRQVIGWSTKDVDMKDGGELYADYVMVGSDGESAAGVCHARGENAGLPPVWMLYLPVGDLAESVRRVREEGGKVLKAALGEGAAYPLAVVQDPVGAVLALVQG